MRKQIIRILLLVLIILLNLAGCGGGSGNSNNGENTPTPTPQVGGTTQINGSVNTQEINGNNLHVVTYNQESSQINNGTFSTKVSDTNPQLVLITDENSNIRAWAVSTPNSSGQNLTIDVSSTAATMVFVSPGIISTDPNETLTRLEQIKKLNNFSSLANLLKSKIQNNNISLILKDTSVSTLLANCINEWLNIYKPGWDNNDTKLYTSSINVDNKLTNSFWIYKKDDSSMSSVKLDLENSAVRYVNVYRLEYRDDPNNPKIIPEFEGFWAMSGANPLSIGTLFTWTQYKPTVKNMSYDFTGVKKMEFWILGPGWKAGDQIPDCLKSKNSAGPWALTIYNYLFSPVLDLWTGGNAAFKLIKGNKIYDAMEYTITSVNGNISLINSITNADSFASRTATTLNFAKFVFDTLDQSGAFFTLNPWVKPILASTTLGIGSANLSAFIGNFINQPPNMKIEVLPESNYALQFTCTVGGVSFNIHYVPAAASFPTGTDDSGTGSVSNAYRIAETEVTYQLWNAVYTWATDAARGANQYHFQNIGKMGYGTGVTNQHPVTYVSWRDAIVWCNALTEYYNAQNGTSLACVYTYSGAIVRDSRDSNATACDNVIAGSTAKGFRLPTSMEWELAARYQNGTNWTPGNHVSGDTTSYCYPSNAGTSTVFGNYAWYSGNSGWSTHPVASTPQKNALGLYDISGNVEEWCFDWYPGYEGSPRVLRGGGWGDDAYYLRVGCVDAAGHPECASDYLGFRPVRTE